MKPEKDYRWNGSYNWGQNEASESDRYFDVLVEIEYARQP